MARDVHVETKKGTTVVTMPEGFDGQIILHCSSGLTVKYNVSSIGRPSSSGVRDISEVRRTGSSP